MTHNFEHISYVEADRITMLENRAAELERRLLEVTPPGGEPPGGGSPRSDGRTEELINRGRQRARQPRTRWLRAHWRGAGLGAGAVFLAILVLALVLALVGAGGGPSWPASVAQVQAEITQACQNPNVAAEPSQVDFACAKPTRAVLWVFSLLASGDNPAFVDPSTGREGLEPIQPGTGGDIAWSLNLHHPYDPASAVDSLQVAARAINNIIGGATVTNASGSPVVEPGLESKAANCQRYTGSPQVVSSQGFPPHCASEVTSPAGLAALVSDVFQQWTGGTPGPVAAQAGVLFENADNPGDPRVRAILARLPAAGE